MHASPIVKYDENHPRVCIKLNSIGNAPKFPSDEICKLCFDNTREISFLSISSSRNNVGSLSQFRTDSAFTLPEWKDSQGSGGLTVPLGFVPKLCLAWASDINHGHLEFRKQEPDNTLPQRLFLRDTRPASPPSQKCGSPSSWATGNQAPVPLG